MLALVSSVWRWRIACSSYLGDFLIYACPLRIWILMALTNLSGIAIAPCKYVSDLLLKFECGPNFILFSERWSLNLKPPFSLQPSSSLLHSSISQTPSIFIISFLLDNLYRSPAMPKENYGNSYTIPSSGTNSNGNHYCSRDYGSSAQNQNSYHYSNKDGSYYYSNSNGSTYYNPGSSGKGQTTYTPSSSPDSSGKSK